jgi:hypothetical protein
VNLTTALHALFVDLKFQAAVVLIILDVAFGSLAALKSRTFRFAYWADFARSDVAFKLAPWAMLYVAAKFASGQQLVIPGIDLAAAATAFYVVIVVAWSGSLAGSLKELGVPIAKALPALFTGKEQIAPPPAPPPPEA